MNQETFGWGIIGPGGIAQSFATGLSSVPGAKLVAVGSRNADTAQQFAEKFGADASYGSYLEVVTDPNVDAIYVATPHPFHREHTILALEHGKAVLCEKPFAINASETEDMVAVARKHNTFLMEAMWTRCLPLVLQVKQLLGDGAIGEPRMLQADFGFRAGIDPNGRLFNLALGGGSLLDVGIYPISLSSMIFGTPIDVAGLADIGSTGVDEQAGFILKHAAGQLSVLCSAVRTNTTHEATIYGTDGSIRINTPWFVPKSYTITKDGKSETIEVPFDGNGYNYEAVEVAACVRAGKTESSVIPLSETINMQKTLDAVRTQFGIKYPNE